MNIDLQTMSFSPRFKRIASIIAIIVLSLVVGYVLLFCLIPILSTKLILQEKQDESSVQGKQDESSVSWVITALAVIISVVAIAINLIKESLKDEYSTKHSIKLIANVYSETVIITCSFKNESKNRIYPRNFYLFIDESKPKDKDGLYEFHNVLEHEVGTLDCELGKKCKDKNKITGFPFDLYPEEDKKLFHKFYLLKHLSPNSVSFIDPGEMFSEDVSMTLDKGVYRAILVCTATNHDCVCTNVQFVVRPEEIKFSADNSIASNGGVKQ